MADQPVRLAAVSYLNTRPLIHALLTGEVPGYDVVQDVPSHLPAMVQRGDAALGLLPCGYCALHPELSLVEGVGIACRGPVRSILLLTRREARLSEQIAVTKTSMSSVALLKLLLTRHFGSKAAVTPSDDPVGDLQSGRADGALLIGDPALQVEGGEWRTYDLGEEWFRLTGLPFVFALWAGPDRELVERVTPDLVRAMKIGRAAIPALAAEAGPELGLPPGLCEDYLSNFIIHDVGPSEIQGYQLFKEMLQSITN